jgi:UDP-4-amino-4,6-dideoxy-N-acetyl-beta-L-altrosamine transaminase
MKMLLETTTDFLPYARQNVTDADKEAVLEVLGSDRLTQGPAGPAFEAALRERVGAAHAVACANGTAALHLAMMAIGIGPGDTVVTSPVSFLASANCARFVGADVRFVDIDARTGLMDIWLLRETLGSDADKRIKAVVPIHFAGQPVDLGSVRALAEEHGAWVVDDACHALGASYMHNGRRRSVGCGADSDMSVYSFHPVKHVAMGEGGAITTGNVELAERLCMLRSHGMRKNALLMDDLAVSEEGEINPWYYEMHDLGFNYRLSDVHAALGLSQLKRLDQSLDRRRRIAADYSRLIAETFPYDLVKPLAVRDGALHAYHLYVVQIDFASAGVTRATVMRRLRERGIGTQVHYIPIHLQPYYRNECGTEPGDCPQAERYYERALSLPMFPELTQGDVQRVVECLRFALEGD